MAYELIFEKKNDPTSTAGILVNKKGEFRDASRETYEKYSKDPNYVNKGVRKMAPYDPFEFNVPDEELGIYDRQMRQKKLEQLRKRQGK